jgi:hypothetical protein
MPGRRKPQASRRRRTPRAKSRSRRSTPKARVARASQSKRSFSARDRSQHALRDMRHGATFSQAARDNGITTQTMKKYVGSALVQDRAGGRIRATKSDRLVRYLQLPGLNGPIEIRARGSKVGSEAASYKADVNRRLAGDIHALDRWHGKKIAGVDLITDVRILKRLAQDEMLPYSLYRSLSGGGR